MNSLILSTATRFVMPLLILFSAFLLIRGHNEPGGGFAGGLVAAAALALFAFTFGTDRARQTLRIDPYSLIGWGLLVAVVSGFFGMVLQGQPFLSGVWLTQTIPVIGKVGTPLLFDVGVYMVVIGISLLIIFSLAEEE